jgi:signal transduction histidine kinase
VIWLRRHGLDVFLVTLSVLVVMSVVTSSTGHRPQAVVISTASLLCFLARRLSPLAVSLVSFGLLALGMSIEPSATPVQFVAMLATFVCVGAINAGRRLVVAAIGGVALLGYATLGLSTGAGWPDFTLSTCIAMGFLLAGWQISRRIRQVDVVRAAARQAITEHAAEAQQALHEERARIARELHDVVSHGLTVVVVQSQAARRGLDDSVGVPAATLRHLDAVETTARQALGEMRRMLGLLQLDDVGPTEAYALEPPSPGLADLATLVERARGSGIEVVADLPSDLARTSLGPGLELVVYRIVQESLTNVIKHAPGTRAGLRLRVARDLVEVVVRNPAPALTSGPLATDGGHGLIGMRERATTYGGRCAAGPDGDAFEVRVELPLEPSDGRSGR